MAKPSTEIGTKTLTTVLLILTLISISSNALARQHRVLIYIRDDVYIDYQKFVADKDISSIDNFSGKNIRRDVVDMIIAQQALKLGGFSHNFTYAPGKVNFRNTKMLQNGQLLISFDSYWQQDALPLADKVYISDVVIRNGEYIAGIYTSPKNTKTLAIKELSDLTELTAVSTPKWRTDWQTTPDQSFVMNKVHLVPVKNIGVVLKDSRHFVISKKHPEGKEAYIAINKGLKILRQHGAIVKAYQQAGFFVDRNKVKIINP